MCCINQTQKNKTNTMQKKSDLMEVKTDINETESPYALAETKQQEDASVNKDKNELEIDSKTAADNQQVGDDALCVLIVKLLVFMTNTFFVLDCLCFVLCLNLFSL